jgi:hypothetical protein
VQVVGRVPAHSSLDGLQGPDVVSFVAVSSRKVFDGASVSRYAKFLILQYLHIILQIRNALK